MLFKKRNPSHSKDDFPLSFPFPFLFASNLHLPIIMCESERDTSEHDFNADFEKRTTFLVI
jgi:hypothetical protein